MFASQVEDFGTLPVTRKIAFESLAPRAAKRRGINGSVLRRVHQLLPTLYPVLEQIVEGIIKYDTGDIAPKGESLEFARIFFERILSEEDIIFFWQHNLIEISYIYRQRSIEVSLPLEQSLYTMSHYLPIQA